MSCRCWLSLLLLVTVLPLIKGQNDPPPEKTIYIPYNRLWETFEKDKRGVFLPYEQFQQLWQKAYGDKPVEPAPLPRDSTISAVQGFLSIGENSAEGSLKLTLHPHQKGWQVIPLRLGECAILDFSAERPDTWLIQDDKQGFALLIKKYSGHSRRLPCQPEIRLRNHEKARFKHAGLCRAAQPDQSLGSDNTAARLDGYSRRRWHGQAEFTI